MRSIITRTRQLLQCAALLLASPSEVQAQPPQTFHKTTVGNRNGAMAILVDGKPITGLGWNSICAQQVPEDIEAMNAPDHNNAAGAPVVGSDFKLARLLFVLGRDVYRVCPDYPYDQVAIPGRVPQFRAHPEGFTRHESWDGGKSFDWTFLDTELDRRLAANPKVLILLQVALDGARVWEEAHKEGLSSTAIITQTQPEKKLVGVAHPDYSRPEWLNLIERSLAGLVSHIQSKSQYNRAVIGYELFNGPSLDTNPRVDPVTPSGVTDFRRFLQRKYQTPSGLRAAWQVAESPLSFDNALPQLANEPAWWATNHEWAPLFVPSSNQQRADTRQYAAWSEEKVVRHFAAAIKSLTHERALVGARFGEVFNGCWFNLPQDESWGASHAIVHYRNKELYSDPNLDFFEIWEPYGQARVSGYSGGSGVPMLPVTGLQAKNKLYIVQNDLRTYPATEAGDQKEDMGYSPDFVGTLTKQRRVFVNALVNGMTEYLWQMSYPFHVGPLMPEWKRHEDIFARALNRPRGSVAEVAYVVDPELGKYMVDSVDLTGRTPRFAAPVLKDPQFVQYDAPSMAQYLTQFPMNNWARAGVPFDMIFLDQVASGTNKPYKVYVFFQTIGLSPAQMDQIHAVLASNRAVGIFVWADGLINASGSVDRSAEGELLGPSRLAGMAIKGDYRPRSTSFMVREPLKGGDRWKYPVVQGRMSLYPSFWVVPQSSDTVLATYETGEAAVVTRKMAGWHSIYSVSPHLPPELMRYALALAGAQADYIDTEDNLYLNQSFLGINTAAGPTGALRAREIHVRLPETPVLHSVLPDINSESDPQVTLGTDGDLLDTQGERVNSADIRSVGSSLSSGSRVYEFIVPVKDNRTYLFYRGDARSWSDAKRSNRAGAKVSGSRSRAQ